jgi:hypothetical protein
MRTKRLYLAVLLLVPLGAALARPQEKQAAPAGAPKDDPAMAKMIEYGKIGPHHERLASRLGTWSAVVKIEMEPGSPPSESQGTSEMRWIMGGRFLQDTFAGEFMGQPFHGLGTTGYDNLKQKYVSTWIDDMSSGIYYSEGTYDPAKKTFTFTGEAPNEGFTGFVKTRMTETWLDDDHFTVQSFVPGPDGKERKSMEIHFTRVK